ncbi:MAG: flagellar biosynthetic protein FliO [Lachnospiraceae bacterium]|nr:flagellar biosynthetic protein FliO [Lachnospiraceae bacterium]
MSGRVEGAAQFLTVFVIFLLVLAITYYTTRFVGRYQKLQGLNRNFEAIETYRVTGNKFLQLVRIGKRYFVIAVGKDEINLISEISADDFEMTADNVVANDRFKQILEVARDKITRRGDK